MNTILVPLDFSAVSDAVVRQAVRLSKLGKSHLILLHVVQQPPVITTDYVMTAYDNSAYMEAANRASAHRLASLQTSLKRKAIAATVIRRIGQPVTHILAQAKRHKADYIVIGSHGHTAVYDLLIGGTTSAVLKRATTPVVVVPSPRLPAPRKAKRRR